MNRREGQAMTFLMVLEAFEAGYEGRTWARDWSPGLLRWAFEMGRRQVKDGRPPRIATSAPDALRCHDLGVRRYQGRVSA